MQNGWNGRKYIKHMVSMSFNAIPFPLFHPLLWAVLPSAASTDMDLIPNTGVKPFVTWHLEFVFCIPCVATRHTAPHVHIKAIHVGLSTQCELYYLFNMSDWMCFPFVPFKSNTCKCTRCPQSTYCLSCMSTSLSPPLLVLLPVFFHISRSLLCGTRNPDIQL